MNDYLIFVNGQLAPHDVFKATQLNSANLGKFLRLSSEALKKIPERIDVLEVRASSITKRYAWKTGDVHKKIESDDGAQDIFNCVGIPSTF